MENLCKWNRTMVNDFPNFKYPWEIIDHLKISELKTNFKKRDVEKVGNAEVFCGENVEIQPYVLFSGRVIIGNNTKIGPFNFFRGPMIIGSNCIIGPLCELVRMILQDNVILAHKNLMGDSIISSGVSCAGMTTICNFPSGRNFIKANYYDEDFNYSGEKYGALIEENSKMGLLTIIMPGAHIYPNTKIIGQSVVSGKNNIRSMVSGKKTKRIK